MSILEHKQQSSSSIEMFQRVPVSIFKMGVRLSRLQAFYCSCRMGGEKIMVNTVMGKKELDKIKVSRCRESEPERKGETNTPLHR